MHAPSKIILISKCCHLVLSFITSTHFPASWDLSYCVSYSHTLIITQFLGAWHQWKFRKARLWHIEGTNPWIYFPSFPFLIFRASLQPLSYLSYLIFSSLSENSVLYLAYENSFLKKQNKSYFILLKYFSITQPVAMSSLWNLMNREVRLVG